jgi:hypothetical protein
MLYNSCMGIYKFGNNTYPQRIRRGSNLGQIFREKMRVLWAGKYGTSLSDAIILWVCSQAAVFDTPACPQPQLSFYISSGLSVVCHDSRAWIGEYGRDLAHSNSQLWSIGYRIYTQWILDARWRHPHSKCLWHGVRIPERKVTWQNKIVNLWHLFIIMWNTTEEKAWKKRAALIIYDHSYKLTCQRQTVYFFIL